MEYQVTLDGTVLASDELPGGLRNMELTDDRDPKFHGLLSRGTSDLTFINTGYDQLKDAFDTSPCGEMTCLIEYRCSLDEPYATLFDGIIFVNNAEFDLRACTARVKVRDKTFQARIRNNRRIKAHLDADKSKNDVAITPVTAVDIDLFNPTSGSYTFTTSLGWRVGDAFKYLVAFMTDGEASCYSTLFDTSYTDNWYNLMICTGYSLANNDGDAPYFSFEELFEEIDRRIPLSLTVEEDVNGDPLVRIELRSYAFDDSLLAGTFRNIGNFDDSFQGLTLRNNTDLWFSKILVGSATTQKSEGGTYVYPDVLFSNWKEEEYHVVDGCNTDNELELIGEWIVDSNVIEDVLTTPNDEFDEDLFLVECFDDSGVIKATAYDDLDPAGSERFYNKFLQNEWIIKRYAENYLPGNLAQFISVSTQDNLFSARLNADDTNGGARYLAGFVNPINADPYPFDNEIFDNGGNYNPATYRYTAPSNGFYRFTARPQAKNIDITVIGGLDSTFEFTVEINHYDNVGTLIGSQSEEFVRQPVSGISEFFEFNSSGFYMNSGDYVDAVISARGTSGQVYEFDIGENSEFRCDFAFNGGGIVSTSDPDTYRSRIYEFEYPLSPEDYFNMLLNRNGVAKINQQYNEDFDIEAFLQQIIYKFDDGVLRLTVIR